MCCDFYTSFVYKSSKTMRVCVIFLSTICFADAFSSRRCLLYNKKCVDHCPRDMHAYHTRCDGQTMSQRTCDDPKTYVIGYTCGWSRCDCNGDKALDEDSGLCVDYGNCPPELPRGAKGRKRKFGRRVRLPVEDDFRRQRG